MSKKIYFSIKYLLSLNSQNTNTFPRKTRKQVFRLDLWNFKIVTRSIYTSQLPLRQSKRITTTSKYRSNSTYPCLDFPEQDFTKYNNRRTKNHSIIKEKKKLGPMRGVNPVPTSRQTDVLTTRPPTNLTIDSLKLHLKTTA